jgi:hypothetical protein
MPRLAAHSAIFLAGVALGVMAGYLVGLDGLDVRVRSLRQAVAEYRVGAIAVKAR